MPKVPSAPLLDVKDLKVYFPIEKGVVIKRTVDYVKAVNGISFSVYPGEVLGLVGESGCGKTSTIRALMRLIPANSGTAMFEGTDILTADKHEMLTIRRDMQMVFQDPYSSLDPRMTIENIIAEPLHCFRSRGLINMTKKEISERVDDLMESVGLSTSYRNRYSYEFSGGQRQRVGIARVLATNPRLLLADEPVSALDVSIQAQILNLLSNLRAKLNLTYLIIAHDLAVVRFVSDWIAVMYLGKIIELVRKEQLYKNPLHPYTQALLSAVPIPDPKLERERERIILHSDVTTEAVEEQGCCFYHRCPLRMPKCRESSPPLKEADSGHNVACFLY